MSLQDGLQQQHQQERQRATTDRFQRARAEFRSKRYIDQAKDTQFTDAWILLALIITLIGLAADSRFLTAAALCLLIVPLAGWAWNSLALFGVDYARRLSETRAFLGEAVELTLEVHNRKWLPVAWLHILDIFPPNLPIEGQQVRINALTNQGEFLTFWNPGVFGRLTRRFTIRCTRRGYFTFGPAVISTGDGFGMFARRGTLPLRQQLIVYPRLYTAEELGLPAKNPFGERAAAARLVEDPLRTAGIRAWEPADGLKRVHWKATARHQALLSRVYEPSQEPQILIFLNVATMERHWLGHVPELMERTISVAGSLAAICAAQRLPVGLIANGVLPGSDQPLRLLPGRSPAQLVHILELLAAVTAFASRPIEELLLHEAPRLPWGATLLVVSAIAHDPLLAALQDLQRAGRRVVLFTLAAAPPRDILTGVTVYHMPQLVADVIRAARLQ